MPAQVEPESRVAPEAGAPRAETAPRPVTAAALVAFGLCVWGQSLLLFDWARRTSFEPEGNGHLVLVVPVFAGAAVAAAVAWYARRRGAQPVGGPLLHALGLASGLLGVTAVALVLWLGPSVRHGGELSRLDAADRQLRGLVRALDLHVEDRGTFPVGQGVETLAAALAPEYLEESFPVRDPWGSELHYQSLGGGAGYLLLSPGPDRVQDLSDDEYINQSTSRRSHDDLVVISGRIVAGPSAANSP